MLTEPAFNALLKTLEEPPPHVIFALVTTDPHKIPATIASRCQRFDFRRISLQAIVDRLAYIAGQEGIVIEPAALELIAHQGTGALRDAISLLDQLTSYGEEITLDQVQMVLGTIAGETAGTLARCLADADVGGGLDQINRAVADGADPRQLGREVVEYLRGLLLLRQGAGTRLLNATAEQAAEMETLAERLSTEQLLQAIRLFNEAVTAVKGGLQMIPQLPLELALVESIMHSGAPAVIASSANGPAGRQKAEISTPPVSQIPDSSGTEPRRVAEAAPDSHTETETQTESPAAAKTAPVAGPETSAVAELGTESPAPESRTQTEPEPGPGPENKATSSPPAAQDFGLHKVVDAWEQLLGAVRQRNPTTQAVLNTGCEPVEVNGNQIVVTFPHAFLREKLRDPQRLMEIQEAMGEVLKTRCRVKFVLASDYAPGHHAPSPTAPAKLEEPALGVEKEPPAQGTPLAEGDLDQIKDWAEKHGGQTKVINEP
jgi:DNA polymerase-3 subunit gamma/tau